MKKILLITLAIFSCMVMFADNFNLNKFNEIKKTNKINDLKKYCAESSPTLIGIQNGQHIFAFDFLLKNKNLTKDQVVNICKPFSDIVKNEKQSLIIGFIALEKAGLYTDAFVLSKQLYDEYKIKMPLERIANYYISKKDYNNANKLIDKYDLVRAKLKMAQTNKDYNSLWQISSNILCDKEIKNPKIATNILYNMFKFKPNKITKEEQIILLEKLYAKYPPAGANFNEWKDFATFINFKYKFLTRKNIIK